jgi:hypothetical protein
MSIGRGLDMVIVSRGLITVHEDVREGARSLTELNPGFSQASHADARMRSTDMRIRRFAAMVIGALMPVPALALTQPVQPGASTTVTSQSPEAVHATRGVVKTISATTLVVTRPRHRGDILFTLAPAPHIEGTIVVGATVSVRYRDEGEEHIATAIAVKNKLESAR